MNHQGKLIYIGEELQVSPSFRVRYAVIEIDGQYPQQIKFQFSQDKGNLLNDKKLFDIVKIEFTIKGKSYISRTGETDWINTLDAWKIDIVSRNPQHTESAVDKYFTKTNPQEVAKPQAPQPNDDDSDVPF